VKIECESCRAPICRLRAVTSIVIIVFVSIARPAYSGPEQTLTGSSPTAQRRHIYVGYSMKTIKALDRDWLKAASTSVTWDGINAWQRFVIADSLTQYAQLTGDRSRVSEIERAIDNHEGLDGNDDDLWAVIASINIYRLDASPHFLYSAQSNFTRITSGYWDATCGGGIWWDHERTYKNAITNELLLYAATSLFLATGDPSYSIWAHREWQWFSNSGLINDRGLINDGLNNRCVNNGQTTWTYNQGVVLGGLIGLYLIERDDSYILIATRLAKSTISGLTTAGGILRESLEHLNQDGQAFKGIFAQYLGYLVPFIEDPRDRHFITEFIYKNADCIWIQRGLPGNEMSGYWDGIHALYGAAAQASAIALFNAAIASSR
jgi:predicted alpha-1,6-mannanase (GH76 family)